MNGIRRFEADFSSISSKSQNQSGSINVFQRDNEVYVKAGEGSTHILADRHCFPCSSAFQELQQLAVEERDGGLYALAVEQTERRREAMEQAAVQIAGAMKTAVGGPKNPFGVKPPGGEATEQAALLLPPRKPREDEVELSTPDREVSQRIRVASMYPAGTRAGTEAAMGPEERAARGIEARDEHGHTSDEAHGSEATDGTHTESEKPTHAADSDLSEEELREVEELLHRDREVKAHEQAHKSAAGNHAGAIALSYKTGPDGKRYAVEGEVPVDLTPVANKPDRTIQKMRQIQRAATAPADPSAADRRIAARAGQISNEAQAELLKMQREEKTEDRPKKPGESRADDSVGSDQTTRTDDGESPQAAKVTKGDDPEGHTHHRDEAGPKNASKRDHGPIRVRGPIRSGQRQTEASAIATTPPKPAEPAAAVPGSFKRGG